MRLKLDEVFEGNVSAVGRRMKPSGFKYNNVTLVCNLSYRKRNKFSGN